jgi:hypothetical protein
MNLALYIIGAGLLLAGMRAGAEEKWAVHEWGTFTALQDESGAAIGGINTDDEPVPPFVHRSRSARSGWWTLSRAGKLHSALCRRFRSPMIPKNTWREPPLTLRLAISVRTIWTS